MNPGPSRGGPRKYVPMISLFRLPGVLAAAITSLFVARDALNFGIIETLLMITLVVGGAVIVAGWSVRRRF
jgi:hypothetical protein